jgi:hypothetical protein
MLMETQILFDMKKIFFPKLYKFHNLYILIDFYLILPKEVCPRSS